VVIKVDGQDVTSLDEYTIIKLVRGPAGSNVHLTVRRPDVADLLEFDVVRARITIPSVESQLLDSGVGYVSVQIPNASSGPALMVVFARSQFDDRLTSYEVYSFAHLSSEPLSNNSYFDLSPLDYSLTVNPKNPETIVENSYAFSYGYQSNLTLASENTYSIPASLDKSPTVLVLRGVNGSSHFAEWVSYPQIPLQFGADFSGSEENVFTYTVMIKENLYMLTVRFGDVFN